MKPLKQLLKERRLRYLKEEIYQLKIDIKENWKKGLLINELEKKLRELEAELNGFGNQMS
jgi:hypothetical protein